VSARAHASARVKLNNHNGNDRSRLPPGEITASNALRSRRNNDYLLSLPPTHPPSLHANVTGDRVISARARRETMITARVVSRGKTRNGIPGNNSSQRARADIACNLLSIRISGFSQRIITGPARRPCLLPSPLPSPCLIVLAKRAGPALRAKTAIYLSPPLLLIALPLPPHRATAIFTRIPGSSCGGMNLSRQAPSLPLAPPLLPLGVSAGEKARDYLADANSWHAGARSTSATS